MSHAPASSQSAAWRPDTIVLHAGYDGLQHQRSAAVPIYQTSSFLFENAQHGAELFDLVQEGPVYARTGNPTQVVLEQRIAQLEGGAAALAVASGMAAIDITLATLAQAGDHVILASALYGGTHNLVVHVLQGRGIASTVVARGDSDALRAAITERTKAVFLESVGNPSGEVADIAAIAALAHDHGVAVVVDNTSATPLLIRPLEHGADVVLHSATKYIGGHGAVIGGLIVDGGRFDWNAQTQRYPQLTRPDPAFHHVVFTERYPEAPLLARARTVMLRNAGATLAAHSAFLLLQGLETLALRMERISNNTLAVLDFLQVQPQVARVFHAAVSGHADREQARRYLRGGLIPGLLSFELHGGRAAARQFYDALQLFLRLVNIGDSKSLAAIPAETTHHLLSDAELARVGIAPGLVRLSIGIEHPDDLLADLGQALKQATATSDSSPSSIDGLQEPA
ncbi:O-acetylhomoserine aminocarboxypropyltransferase/cysteine synthase family protein [Comamonas guangdongensis]|uniref:O-acetylhomoserine aminocarboxypropyltransferase/cysteine synthase family protein n=1 Tax=Comamonas guangdongensis TaxID=510515 RepID=A0ABV4A0I3_9BURK